MYKRLWWTLWEIKGNKWQGICPWKTTLSWRGKKNKWKMNSFINTDPMVTENIYYPGSTNTCLCDHPSLSVAGFHHSVLTLWCNCCSMFFVLNIHCHPKWSQILPSLQININTNDSQICISFCSGITFSTVCWPHSRGTWSLSLLHSLHPSSRSRFHWSKNPIHPPG